MPMQLTGMMMASESLMIGTDVFASIGNYLVKNGYPVVDPTNQEKIYKSVYAYNHADNYVKAVLELRKELEKSIIKD